MDNRIALVSGNYKDWNSGASTVFLHLERELLRLGCNVRLFHLADYFKRVHPSVDKFTPHFQLAWMLGSELSEYDAVEVAGNLGGNVFRKIAKTAGAKRPLRIMRIHGLEFKDEQARINEEIAGQINLPRKYKLLSRHFVNWQERRTLASADLVICHSSRDSDAIATAGWKSSSDIEVMPLGVDGQFLVDRPYSSSGNRLIWWGSWVERKGISSLPRAFELSCDVRPDLTLTIGGTGCGAEEVLAPFPAELRGRISVLPFLTREEHIRVLRSHDIFLFPSLSEGFGLALLEAMATGLPVVTTFTGFAHDWLEHGDNCLLVPMSAPTAISRAILRLSESQVLRKKIGTGARQTAEQLTWERLAHRTAKVYEERLARR